MNEKVALPENVLDISTPIGMKPNEIGREFPEDHHTLKYICLPFCEYSKQKWFL